MYSKTTLLLLVCLSLSFYSCEPETLPTKVELNEKSAVPEIHADTGNEHNEVDDEK